jgi:hypothetical protein
MMEKTDDWTAADCVTIQQASSDPHSSLRESLPLQGEDSAERGYRRRTDRYVRLRTASGEWLLVRRSGRVF